MTTPRGPLIWERLGLAPTREVSAIRRAYAQALRRTHPEDDPEGFASLRAAYEAALRQAEGAGVPRAPTPGRETPAGSSPMLDRPETPSLTSPSPSPSPPTLTAEQAAAERLRSDCRALQTLLSSPQPPDEHRALELVMACLSSPALESLDRQLTIENWFAVLLWQHRERTEALLEPVIERFGWRAPGRAHALLPLLVAYADRVRELGKLKTQVPRAYRALTRAPHPAWLWLQIVLLRVDEEVRPVWAVLTAPYSGAALPAPRATSSEALAWWRRYFTAAHVQPSLLRLTGLFMALGAIVGVNVSSNVGGPDNGRIAFDVGRDVLLGAALGLALTVLQLFCVEWPRRHWRASRTSLSRRVGWYPAAWALCLIACVLPSNLAVVGGVALGGLAVLAWAILAAPAPTDGRSTASMRRFLGMLMMNIPLAVWGIWIHAREPVLLPMPLIAASLAWVTATTLGQGLLWMEVRYALSPSARRSARSVLACLAVLALLALVSDPASLSARRALLVMAFGIVLLQRVGAMGLTARQLKARYYLTVIPALVAGGGVGTLDDPLRNGGAIFMTGVVLTLLAWDWNEWRAARVEQGPSVAKARL